MLFELGILFLFLFLSGSFGAPSLLSALTHPFSFSPIFSPLRAALPAWGSFWHS